MNHLSGSFILKTGRFDDISDGAFSHEDDSLIIRWLGGVAGEEGVSGLGPDISGMYLARQDRITEHLNGLYLIVIYDKRKLELHVYHGLATFPLPMYYTIDNGVLRYSTSLKILLKSSGIRRRFDKDGLREFLVNGHVTGTNTLVENVCKLAPFNSLSAGRGTVSQVPVRYSVQDIGEKEAADKWNSVLERSIAQSFAGEKEINMAVSSGYDSNHILYVASQSGLPINAFSIGGGSGIDELPVVKQCGRI